MPISALTPYCRKLYTATALAATANSGTLDFPVDMVGGSFILDRGLGTGTSPTIDVALQISPDGGTTWYTFSRFAQQTTTAAVQVKICSFRPTNVAALVFTSADTGGVLENNMPMTGKIRVLATVGGTNPSYATVNVWFIGWREGYTAGT